MLFLIAFGVYADFLSNNYGLTAPVCDNYSSDYNNSFNKSINMVWVIIDQLDLEVLISTNTPNIDYLQEQGAFSLMNVRTVGYLNSESTYLSANAGNRCQGSKMSHNGISYGNGAINENILELIRINKETEYRANPGLLGDIAKKNDIKIGVLGNSDIVDEEIRTIVSMAMDSNGFVPLAQIDKNILEEVDLPWKYQSDFEELQTIFIDFQRKADVIFIETGDMSRIEHYYQSLKNIDKNFDKSMENCLLSDKTAEFISKDVKIRALERIDNFIGFLMKNLNLAETQLGIISPTPPMETIEEGSRLGWILLAGKDIEHGWLSASSTRRNGIITISDLLPIFLKANSINFTEDINFVVAVKDKLEWSSLYSLNRKLLLIYNLRSPFLKTFIFFQIIVIIMAIVKIVFKDSKYLFIFSPYFEYLLLALLLVPINTLLIAFLPINSAVMTVILLLLFIIIEELILLKYVRKKIIHILIISWILLFLIIIDLFNNYQVLGDSLLGYSSIIGARYYGLGNEYMGFYLGAFVLAITVSLEILKDKVELKNFYLIPFFIILVYSIGAVNLGANFGGMITALLTVAVIDYYIEKRSKLLIITTAIAFLLILVIIDYSGAVGSKSHIGNAVYQLVNGDWQWIKDTFFRKFNMNLKLLRWTIWTRVFLAMIVYFIILVRKPVPRLKRFFEKNPYLNAGIYGVLAGSLITMFVNDSGVVAAVTLLFYPVMSLLYLSFFPVDF